MAKKVKSVFESNSKSHLCEFSSAPPPNTHTHAHTQKMWKDNHKKDWCKKTASAIAWDSWENKIQMRSRRLSVEEYRFLQKCHYLGSWKPWVSEQIQQTSKAQALFAPGTELQGTPTHYKIVLISSFPFPTPLQGYFAHSGQLWSFFLLFSILFWLLDIFNMHNKVSVSLLAICIQGYQICVNSTALHNVSI